MRPVWICAALQLPLLGGLLWAKRTERKALEWWIKPLCSLTFLAAVGLEVWRDQRYAGLVLTALIFSWIGDVALLGRSKAWLGSGLGAFLLAHVAYLTAAAPLLDLGRVELGPTLVAGVVLAGLCVLALKPAWETLGDMRGPVCVYACLLNVLTLVGLSVGWQEQSEGGWLLGGGLFLFLLSDLSVLRYRFVKQSFSLKLWGTPAYYWAQLLLAASVSVLPPC